MPNPYLQGALNPALMHMMQMGMYGGQSVYPNMGYAAMGSNSYPGGFAAAATAMPPAGAWNHAFFGTVTAPTEGASDDSNRKRTRMEGW